jgi:CRISPR-associated exonuclease Cas4
MDETLTPVMISALEHYAYCPRQCALIHLEQTFDENVYTLRGHHLHKRVDDPVSAEYDGIRVERAMPLWSKKLGLIGKADIVEFHDNTPYPVEYKSGKKRATLPEKIQLCAQALCLEEMFDTSVSKGALYWIGSKRRQKVHFDKTLRDACLDTLEKVREMLESGIVPPPQLDARCEHCSLRFSCMPETASAPDVQNLLFKEG